MTAKRRSEGFAQQLKDQAVQVENLKRSPQTGSQTGGSRIQGGDSSRSASQGSRNGSGDDAGLLAGQGPRQVALDRLQSKDSVSQARATLLGASVEDRLAAL